MSLTTHKISSKTPWMVADETVQLMSVLNSGESDEARFVGGCVRDALANRETYDVDIAVNYEPARTIELLKSNNIKYVPTGLSHGTVTAIINGVAYEITSLRKDVENYGRHAKVEFTNDWEEDAKRRDFTFNAISANMEGDVFDYFNGVEDLRLGHVRFIGDATKRIEEDYLRILRYFRFFAVFSREEMNEEIFKAIEKCAKGLDLISKERIGVEFLKLLSLPKCAKAIELMYETQVLHVILPNEYDMVSLYRLEELEEKYSNQDNPIRKLATLLEDMSDVVQQLRLANYHNDNLCHMGEVLSDVDLSMDKQRLYRAVYKHGSYCIRSALLYMAGKSKSVENLDELYYEATAYNPPRFPVNGNDVKSCGVDEGKLIGYILKELESWWIDNDFEPKRVECIDKLKEIASKYS